MFRVDLDSKGVGDVPGTRDKAGRDRSLTTTEGERVERSRCHKGTKPGLPRGPLVENTFIYSRDDPPGGVGPEGRVTNQGSSHPRPSVCFPFAWDVFRFPLRSVLRVDERTLKKKESGSTGRTLGTTDSGRGNLGPTVAPR